MSPSEATAAESFAKGRVKADVMSRVIVVVVVVVVIIIVVFILDCTVITTIVVPLHCETLDDGTAERERERYYFTTARCQRCHHSGYHADYDDSICT